MLKFELNSWKQFCSIIETADRVMDELIFTADSEGLRFSVLDRAHICFFNSDFKTEYFDEYSIDDYETFAIATSDLNKVLKRIKSDDTLKITVDNNAIEVVFDGKGKRTFTINQIDVDYDSPTAPQLNLPINEEISFKHFKETVKDCELFGDKLTIATEGNRIIIGGGDEFGKYSGEIYTDLELESVKSVFAIEKVKDIFKIAINDELEICIGRDTPLLLKFEDNFGLNVSYMIAPRIEAD